MFNLNIRIRIGIVLIISFLLSGYLIKHTYEAGSSAPYISFATMPADIQSAFSNTLSPLLTMVQSIRTSSPSLSNQNTVELQTAEPTTEQTIEPTHLWQTVTTPIPQAKNKPTKVVQPTTKRQPTRRATPRPRPTKIQNFSPTPLPKPTNKPYSTPTPALTKDSRPGTSLENIYQIAGEKACVPSAVLKAFVAQEGPGALSYSDESALFYNAYDWWHRAKEAKQVCGGYGYHTETGLIPSDSLFAGEKCKEGFNQSTTGYDSGSIGATQILQSYWDKTYKGKVEQKLQVDKADRRVLLDALVGFGLIVIDNTKYSGSCSKWEFKYVIKAACANAGGSCEPYNYCYTVCNNYNKYSGQNNNCNNVKDLFVPGSYCQFK